MIMRFKGRQGLVALAAVAASVAVSGIGAVSAQAALPAPCTGSNIEGQGSSLQGAAQTIWTSLDSTTTGFNFNTAGGGCNTPRPTVRYTPTSSGRCLDTWGASSGSPASVNTTIAYCGTDDAPTSAQITTINSATRSNVLSIPVAQAAIAILANPPHNCHVTSITRAQLETILRGHTVNWTFIGGTGPECDTHITPIVRADASGTTYQVKRYLTGANTAAVHGSFSWKDLQAPSRNQTWPAGVDFSRSGCFMTCSGAGGTGSGGGDEVKTVGATPNGFGYAALSDARAQYQTTTYSTLRWLRLDQLGTGAAVDPSTNGLNESKGTSTCSTATNTYGTTTAADLPTSATAPWDDVYLRTPGGTYPLCTLTWVTALTHYEPHWGVSGTNIARTVRDFLHYVVNPNGGQGDALGTENDYQRLPTDVRNLATGGVTEITG
jgi:ABC-type phosphate transport system substrate-binding protein